MRRTYLAKRNALFSYASLSWGVAALAVALIALALRLVAPDALYALVSPAFRTGNAVASITHTFFASFRDASSVTIKYEELKKDYETLLREKEALSANQTGLELLQATGGIVAGVVARPPESPYDMLLVNTGENVGVSVGMAAFGPGGTPLGEVTEVSGKAARVTLFSAPGMSTSGWAGEKRLLIQVKGEGSGALSADVPRTSEIEAGDIIFLPGPGALPIGRVIRKYSDDSSPSVHLRIQPNINMYSLTWIELRDVGRGLFNGTSSTKSL